MTELWLCSRPSLAKALLLRQWRCRCFCEHSHRGLELMGRRRCSIAAELAAAERACGRQQYWRRRAALVAKKAEVKELVLAKQAVLAKAVLAK